MCKFLIMLATASVLAGCASTLPNCDGTERRPVNSPAGAGVIYPSCATAV